MPSALPAHHALLAALVVLVWGTNFVLVRWVLEVVPPLALATLRFALAFLPAALFLPRPPVPWFHLAAWGVLIGVGQFGLMFIALVRDITPGMASLVIQTQVFFTIALAMGFERERPRPYQVLALALAAAGLVWIGLASDAASGGTPLGLALVLIGAASWAAANLIARRAGRGVDALAYVVWASAFAVPPLMLLSLFFEGPVRMAAGLAKADALAWAAIVWQALGNTVFGYAAWAWLLARHPAATVSPWALGVPVVGLVTAALAIGEPMPAWKLGASALVIAGLALNLVLPALSRRARPGN
jgi:O-acetylserine/cysteine efflux transporter